jgi:hypothetical protein
MRLTLRTLLAWLDGVLPDDEQQQLGAKVSSSAMATHLVERIRGAVGRAAIGAPKLEGRGLTEDINSVAEYLDNTLSSEQLEAFERICIESEVHLAEVAACHGLLAEVSRDPTVAQRLYEEERERIHQRLLGLLSGLQDRAATEKITAAGDGDGHHESRETARAIMDAMTSATSAAAAITPSRNGDVTPGRGPSQPAAGRSSTAAWAAAAFAVALLLTLAGVLAWSLFGGTRTGRGSGRPPEVAQVQPAASEPAPPAPAAAEAGPAPMAAAVAPVAEGESPNTAEPRMESEQEAEPLKSGEPEPEAEPLKPAEPESPAAPPAAAMAGAPAPAPAVPPAGTPAPADADEAQNDVGFVGGDGVLLRLAEAEGTTEWTFYPVGSPLQRREDLLVPPVFQPELHVRGVTIRLLPETRAVLSLDADGTPRIEVVFGRAVARASRADARLGITAAGLVGTVDAGLLNPVAIQVELDRFTGADPASTPPQVRSRIIAASRGLSWRQTTAEGQPAERLLEGIDAQGMLDAGMSLEWANNAADRVTVARNRGLPAWIESGVRPDRLEKAAGETLAAKVASTTPLARALRELAADKRVENRMLAAATLTLIGEFDDVVEQLAAESPGRKLEPRQWSYLQDATVPLALARGGNAASRLYASFVSRGPHGKADALWAMARGFTDEDLAAGADRAIVEALDDPSLMVRRYAIKSLADITQPSAVDRARYRPDGLPDMRREGVLWWRGQLEKGLIRRSATAAGDADRPGSNAAAVPAEE